MSNLNVNNIQPVGSGLTVTVNASQINASSSTVTASSFVGPLTATGDLTGIDSVSTTNLSVNGNDYPSDDIIKVNQSCDQRSNDGVPEKYKCWFLYLDYTIDRNKFVYL